MDDKSTKKKSNSWVILKKKKKRVELCRFVLPYQQQVPFFDMFRLHYPFVDFFSDRSQWRLAIGLDRFGPSAGWLMYESKANINNSYAVEGCQIYPNMSKDVQRYPTILLCPKCLEIWFGGPQSWRNLWHLLANHQGVDVFFTKSVRKFVELPWKYRPIWHRIGRRPLTLSRRGGPGEATRSRAFRGTVSLAMAASFCVWLQWLLPGFVLSNHG